MLDQFFKSGETVRRLRSGILGAHLDSFAAHLARCGFCVATARSQLTRLGHFDQWLTDRRLGLGALSDTLVDTFVQHRTRVCASQRREAGVIARFFAHLRTQGVIPSPPPLTDETPLGTLLRQYEQYLVLERGLTPATVVNYRGYFREFFRECFGQGPMDLRSLDVPTITTFVFRRAPTMSPGRAKLMGTALRSIFQFLVQRGAIERDLAACVPRVADWRLATLPKYLTPEEVERLLQTCDRQTAVGRRNHAILLLLARLGLRAGEIVTLELGDLHWRVGEITVRSSKRLPHDRLPLPQDVGEALATYLRAAQRTSRDSHVTFSSVRLRARPRCRRGIRSGSRGRAACAAEGDVDRSRHLYRRLGHRRQHRGPVHDECTPRRRG